MRWRKKRLGLWLFLLAYGFAVWWVFTRSTPIIKQRPVTITFAHWQIERGPPDGIAAAIKRYEEIQSRVRVEQLLIPGATVYPQWMRSNLAGDTGPDLMEWGAWIPGQKDIPARYFTPLTAELAKPNPYNRGTSQEGIPWEKTFHDNLIGPRRDSPDPGQVYAVTVSESTVRLFCNVNLLREATGSIAAPKTFDDLRKILARVKDYARRTGRPISGLAGSQDNGLWIVGPVFSAPLLGLDQELDDNGYLYMYNRDVLAAYLAGRWNYRRPVVEAGLTLVREVAQAMKPGFLQLHRDDAMLEFFQGQAVFIYTGTWDATSLRRMAPFPVVPMRLPNVMPNDPEVGRFIIGIGGEGQGETAVAMYLNKNSAHPEEALDFLRFLTSVEGNQLFTDHSLWLPSVNGVKLPEEIKEFRTYQEGYSFGQASYDMIGSEENGEWKRNFHRLIGDQGSVDEFATVLDQVMPVAIRKDLQNEMRNTLLLVKPQDTLIVANAELADATPAGERHRLRQHEMEAGQTMSEGLALQMNLNLEATKEKP
jgi:raffinose/stachyose/melibiose transport system substrate-binding protein